MRALITGVSGFVGQHLTAHLLECGDDVSGACNAGKKNLNLPCFDLDVTDQKSTDALVAQLKPEVIYHLAGIAFVPEAEENFEKTLRVNVLGVHNIIRSVEKLKLGSRIIVVSSGEIYGRISPSDLPLTELTPIRPAHSYSLSKSMAELVVMRYAASGLSRPCIVRPFNHIGPGQDDRFVVSTFARQLARIALGKADKIVKVGNLAARRDFTDVRDIVRGYRLIGQGQGSGDLYQLCSGKAISIQAILDMLIEISALQVKIEQDPARMRPAEVPEIRGSYVKAENELGWRPSISLRQSLEDTYRYWLELDNHTT